MPEIAFGGCKDDAITTTPDARDDWGRGGVYRLARVQAPYLQRTWMLLRAECAPAESACRLYAGAIRRIRMLTLHRAHISIDTALSKTPRGWYIGLNGL